MNILYATLWNCDLAACQLLIPCFSSHWNYPPLLTLFAGIHPKGNFNVLTSCIGLSKSKEVSSGSSKLNEYSWSSFSSLQIQSAKGNN